MGHRSTARRIAMQTLYQSDLTKMDVSKSFDIVINQEKISNRAADFAKSLSLNTWNNISEIDEIIKKHSKTWPLDRISSVDLNILRLAVYEIKFGKNAAIPIVIDEAVKLAHKYGSSDSYKFINGILAEILKSECAKIDKN